MESITISKIHKEFVPKYDRWHGKLVPRIKSWFEHIFEIIDLWIKNDQVYKKHGPTHESSRQHAYIEFGDWLWLTAEIIWMWTKVELPIVPKATLERIWKKMEENRIKS